MPQRQHYGLRVEGANGLDRLSESLLQLDGSGSRSGGGEATRCTANVDITAAGQARARVQEIPKVEEVLEDIQEEGQSRVDGQARVGEEVLAPADDQVYEDIGDNSKRRCA